MSAPVFTAIDKNAFLDGTQLSTAHVKLLSQNILYAGNERLNIAAVSYGKRNYAQNSARRMPQYASAQWVGRGPFSVWGPPLRASSVTAGRDVPFIYLRIVGEVVSESVQVYATANGAPSFEGISFSPTTLSVGAIDQAIPVYGMRAGENDVYLWIRSTADVSAPASLACTRRGFTDPDGWNDESYQATTGTVPTQNPPLRWAAVGYPTATLDTSTLATIDFTDGIDRIVLGEPRVRQDWNGTLAGDTNIDVQFGPLGVLRVFGLFFDETQAMDTLDEAQWSNLRWYQLPSALSLGMAAVQTMQAHLTRLPQLMLGNSEVFDVQLGSTANIGGHWKIYLGGFATDTEVARTAIWSQQEVISTRNRYVTVRVPVMLASGYSTEKPADFSMIVQCYDEDGTTVLSSNSSLFTLSPIMPTSSRTARWVILANGCEDSNGRRFGLDGFTAPEDAGSPVWTFVSLSVDISAISLGSLGFVSVSFGGSTSTPFGHFVVGDISMRTSQG